MELFQELLFTISFSLLVCLLIAKLFSMASDYDVADDKTLSASNSVVFEEENNKESVGFDSESEKKFQCFEKAVKVDDHEEGEFRVDRIGTDEVLREVKVGGLGGKDIEGGVCEEAVQKGECEKEERESVGGDELAEKVLESSETATFREIEIQSFEKSTERSDSRQTEIDLVKSEEIRVVEDEGNPGNESDGVNNEDVDNSQEDGLFDDWEGIERTELEKGFGEAVAFVGSKNNADCISLLDNEVKMQLYGLYKIAYEGPCYEPQPMALKVSARANWNAWKRLGNISPEVAMEQYIALLSSKVPDWMGDETSEDGKKTFLAARTSGKLSSCLEKQPGAENERASEQFKPCIQECAVMEFEDPTFIDRDKQ